MKKIGLFLLLSIVGFTGYAQYPKSDAQLISNGNTVINAGPSQNTASRIGNDFLDIAYSKLSVIPLNATGTNTYVASSSIVNSYSNAIFEIVFQNGNSGAATLNINSLGAVNLQKLVSGSYTALSSGDIQNNQALRVWYDQPNNIFQVFLGGGSGGSTVGSSILSGNGSGGFSNVTVGSNLSFSGGTLNTAATPTLNLTNSNSLPISSGVSGLGTGVATALGLNSSSGATGSLIINPTNAAGDLTNNGSGSFSWTQSLKTANNLSDVADGGSSRLNLRVPTLFRARAVSVTNVASLSGTTTIDGVALAANDRVLLTAQSTASQNGPWLVQSGAWTRPTDFASGTSVQAHTILVAGGTNYAGSFWGMTNNSAAVIDTDAQTWLITNSSNPGSVYNVKYYGAVGDAIQTGPVGTISSSSHNFSCSTCSFVSSDVGKTILVPGAGAAGADLITTISAYSSGTAVTLTGTASTSVITAICWYGTDDTSAITSAISATPISGAQLYFPANSGSGYLVTSTISVTKNLIIYGDGQAPYKIFPTLSGPNNTPFRGGTSILFTSGNTACFSFTKDVTNNNYPVRSVRDLSIINISGATPVSGSAGIYITDNAEHTTIREVNVTGFYYNIWVDANLYSLIDNCRLVSPIAAGVYINNSISNDLDGTLIRGCSFHGNLSSASTAKGVWIRGGGGVQIKDNYFNALDFNPPTTDTYSLAYCIYFDPSLNTTSEWNISGNHFDNFQISAIYGHVTGSTGRMTVINSLVNTHQTTGNTLGPAIDLSNFSNVTIVGYSAVTSGTVTQPFFSCTGGSNVFIGSGQRTGYATQDSFGTTVMSPIGYGSLNIYPIGSTGSFITQNSTYDGTNLKYINSAATARIQFNQGDINFYSGASGTAGSTVSEVNGVQFKVNTLANTLYVSPTGVEIGGNSPSAWLHSKQAALSSAWIPAFQVDPGAHTGQTTATEFPNFVVSSATQTAASGTTPTQRSFWVKAITYAGTSGTRTITDSYGGYFEKSIAGTNGAITRNWGIGTNGNIQVQGSAYIGAATTAPTALLHLAAGTATANTSPLKFTSGTNLTAAEAGALEYDGTSLFFTPGSPTVARYRVDVNATIAAPATTGTVSVVHSNASVITITPTGACTFNASGGVTGQTTTYVITTSGVSSFTLTWGTAYKTTGTLATGTVSGKVFTVQFSYDGTNWNEVARTTAM